MSNTETAEKIASLKMTLPAPDIIEPSAALKMLAVIERAADNPKYNTDKMRALLDMNMELIREEHRISYTRAMRMAQEEMKPVVRKADNKHTKSKYAKLEHIDNLIRPIYTKHGFCLSFDSRKEPDGSHTVMVDVMHDDGHTSQKQLNANIDDVGPNGTKNKTNPQGVSSTVSILKRQLTAMVFNIVFIDEDDDGQGGKIEGGDQFAERVKEGAQKSEATIPAAKPQMTLHEAASELESRIRNAPVEKRGAILMKYVNILEGMRLDGPEMSTKAAELRLLCEERSDG